MPARQVSLFRLFFMGAPVIHPYVHRRGSHRVPDSFSRHEARQNAIHLETRNLARLHHGISPAQPDGHDHALNCE